MKCDALKLQAHEWHSLRNCKIFDEETKEALEELQLNLVEPWGLSKKMFSTKTAQEEVIPTTRALLRMSEATVSKDLVGWNRLYASFGLANVVSFTIIVGLLKSKFYILVC